MHVTVIVCVGKDTGPGARALRSKFLSLPSPAPPQVLALGPSLGFLVCRKSCEEGMK